jgi:predicted O-methyltransferase YrrM
LLVPEAVSRAEKTSCERKLPSIAVPPPLGAFLNVLAGESSRVLEIGTLGGVSTLWLAGGKRHVTTLEINADNAAVARENFVGNDRIELLVGQAAVLLKDLKEKSFDFMFIDADKANNLMYVREGVERLVQGGGLIVVDNVIREGNIVDSDNAACVGTRRMFEYLKQSQDLCQFSALQTLDSKGHDGICLIRVLKN